MYFTHHKVEAAQVLNWLPCIISEEQLINPSEVITRSGIDQATMGIWDKDKITFINPNKLHNEEAMEDMFKGTGITTLDLENLRWRRMVNFDKANLRKYYA